MSQSPLPLFTGCAAALVTPFTQSGEFDEPTFVRLLSRQSDMDAVVILGTTGEPCSLTMQERERIISVAVRESCVPVIVGTGSNNTRTAIEYARQAHRLGASAQLGVTPYYNKTTPAGLLRHYGAILDSCALPLILYNVPARTGMSMTARTVAELAAHPNVIGIKEASGDLALAADILAATDGQLPLYCGNDDLILPMMAMGAVGAISVAANIVPLQIRAITTACLSGCLSQAQAAHSTLLPLLRALTLQVNPIPIKAAMAMMNLIEEVLRLPLAVMDAPQRTQLKEALIQSSLL